MHFYHVNHCSSLGMSIKAMDTVSKANSPKWKWSFHVSVGLHSFRNKFASMGRKVFFQISALHVDTRESSTSE